MTEPLKWPSAAWDDLWQQAQNARLQQLTHQQAAPSKHELDQMLERLANPQVAGRDIDQVRLKWTAGEEFMGPAPVGVLRRRLDALSATALADELVRMSQAYQARGTELELAHAVLRTVLAVRPEHDALMHVVDGHWTATGMRQTLAQYEQGLSTEARQRVSRALRLLLVCAPHVAPAGGGTPPRDLHQQLLEGRVAQDAEAAPFDVDYDEYPGLLLRPLRDVAWEVHMQLLAAWNGLSLPERRLVVAYWHRLPLHGPHVAAGLPQPTALQMRRML